MALAVVTSGGAYVNAGTSISIGPLNVPSGSLIVVDISVYYGLGLFSSVTDTAGNTFTSAYSLSVSDAVNSHATQDELYCANCTGNASNTFTINLTGSGYAVAAVTIISGAATSSPLDKVITDATQNTSTPSTTTAATTQADEIVIGAFSQVYNPSLTLTQASGYTTQYDNFSSGANQTLTVGTKIVSATGAQTYAPSMNSTSPLNIAISTYKAAASGTTYTLTSGSGSFALSGKSINLTRGRTLTAALGTFALSGKTVNLVRGRTLTAAQGAFVLSGQTALFTRGRTLTATRETFSLSGQTANLVRGRTLTASTGAFVLSGKAVSFTYTPAGITYTLAASVGSFTISGKAVSLTAARKLSAGVGIFSLAGKAVTLSWSGAPVVLTYTGYPVLNHTLRSKSILTRSLESHSELQRSLKGSPLSPRRLH